MSETATDLAEREDLSPEQYAAAASAALGELDETPLVLPLVNVAQALSKSVSDGDANQGEFVNGLTGEVYGTELELIVVGYFKGRFYSPKGDDRTYVAQGDIAPSNWPEEYAGRNFADIEDAEEQTKLRANAPGGVWEAPKIQTTHNYVGLIPGEDVPVRFSFKSSGARTHRKVATLIRLTRAPWDNAVELTTRQTSNKSGDRYYEVVAARGRESTSDERQQAVKIAQEFVAAQQGGSVELAGEKDEEGEARAKVSEDTGGLGID